MDSINVNMDNLTPDEREQLMRLVEKGNKPKSKVWKPEIGEGYRTISSSGISYFDWEGDATDNNLYLIGNCYRTKEEAKFALERMKVLTELRRYAQEHNTSTISWDRDVSTTKYRIGYDHSEGLLFVDNNSYLEALGAIYFTSLKIAENTIESVGADRIKKYLFGIED